MTAGSVAAASPQDGHRRDIDGLRAIAVLPVVAYHVGIHAVPGGFVGVDIFFVISGFLITQVLLQDIHNDRFSLVRFYERRVRRILPALLFVLLLTFIVCARYSLPSELIDFSKSLIAAALSVSNIYFWQTSGYFAAPALTKPLLHTWSLAVEEQFYIFWPLLLWLGLRLFKRHLLAATLIVIILSLAVSAVGAFTNASATFYWVHTRAWELLMGGVLPLGLLSRPLGPLLRNVLVLIGVALIAGSVALINADMPFPGLLAVPPCLGAFLIILAGRDGETLAGHVLSWRPIAFIGIISYSLYLWHWPLTVFQKNYALLISGGSDRTQKLVIIAWSLALATLTWRFVEQPFREGSWRPARPALFRFAAAGTALVLALGATVWASAGFPGRYTSSQLRIASFLNYDAEAMFRSGQCFLSDSNHPSFAPDCLMLDPSTSNFLLLGDSHAAELWAGLSSVYPGIHFLQATAADCFPVTHHRLGEAQYCTRAIDGTLHGFLSTHKVDRVLLAARWKADYLPEIAATLDWFASEHIPVTLIGPTVEYDSPLPRLLLTAQRTHHADIVGAHWDHSLLELDRRLGTLASEHGANYISMIDLLCPDSSCATTDPQGDPLISDREHFTLEGAKLVAREMKAQALIPYRQAPLPEARH
jgi:peptidoglycan/LPS O-acetylase OafA/YrhL